MTTAYLFVYGTLASVLDRHVPARFEGTATIDAMLFDLGEYPGAVANGVEKLEGELWLLSDAESALSKLDEYEGFEPDSPSESLFIRQRSEAYLSNGKRVPAWVYFYNQPPRRAKRIQKWVGEPALTLD